MLALKVGVMWPQAKECQWSPEVGRGKEWIFPRAYGESMAQLTPWFQLSDTSFEPLASRNMRE